MVLFASWGAWRRRVLQPGCCVCRSATAARPAAGGAAGLGSTKAVVSSTRSWGRSSAGRARRSQCRGREFDPPRLHHPIPKGRLHAGPFSFGAPSMGARLRIQGTARQGERASDRKARRSCSSCAATCRAGRATTGWHRRRGSGRSWAFPDSAELNFLNRPVWTHMPGGVAGVQPRGCPLCRSGLL